MGKVRTSIRSDGDACIPPDGKGCVQRKAPKKRKEKNGSDLGGYTIMQLGIADSSLDIFILK
jgi:hypothetical protein